MNNYNNTCPAYMNDGRFITKHVKELNLDQYIRNLNNLEDIYEYKNFLQINTNKILENEIKYYENMYKCDVCNSCNCAI